MQAIIALLITSCIVQHSSAFYKFLYPSTYHYSCSVPLLYHYNNNGYTGSSSKVLVSGYNSEIALYDLNFNVLTARNKTWNVDPNISWMQKVGDSFYAVHEWGSGVAGDAISRWTVNEEGDLEKEEIVSTSAGGPVHLTVDTDHDIAITANYGDGSVSVVSLGEHGALKETVQVIKYGDKCSRKSRPHQVILRGDQVWVVDLGCDAIYSYQIQDGKLVQTFTASLADGSGPRHMALVDEAHAVVVNELDNTVVLLDVSPDGSLAHKQAVHFDFESEFNDTRYGGEILVENGYVYASSRGKGVILVFDIVNNSLVKVDELDLEGTWPRSIAIKNGIMLAADQRGDKIQIISIDPRTGHLTAGGSLETPTQPAYIMFYD